MTNLAGLHEKHQEAILAKANRALLLIDVWAINLTTQNPGTTKAQALTEIHEAISADNDAAEGWWTKLAAIHHEYYPNHPGRPEFRTSRDIILTKLQARIWVADQPKPADPFAGLTEGMI
jgi:hypothetical protein